MSPAEDTAAPTTVGKGDYVVREGDCISSIAHDHGFFWETIWNLPENDELKRARENPFVLLKGDRVTVPALRARDESCSAEAKHRFKRKGVPGEIEIVLNELTSDEPAPKDYTSNAEGEYEVPEPPTLEPKPIKDTKYALIIDGVITTGTTDSGGKLRARIPPNARSGQVKVRPGEPDELVIELSLGHLDPVTTWAGLAHRLRNLGYTVTGFPEGNAEGNAPAGMVGAITAFQKDKGQTADGRVTTSLLDAVKQAHGS
jgi:hypothetical protein